MKNITTKIPQTAKPLETDLLQEIRALIVNARSLAVRSINTLQVLTNFEIGRKIVEKEQKGTQRAEYGKKILKELADKLCAEFGTGFSERNLRSMRKFYLVYKDRIEQIRQTASAKSPDSNPPFKLSWSQYVFLLGLKNDAARSFYEIEAAENSWTLPELTRQYNSGLYERLALSRDKKGVLKLAREGQVISQPQDMLKEPYVLEFLGIDEKAKYSESDLEAAIIDKIEIFLLELGKGFLFEARQKRFTFDEDHFFVDLVFYNRLLRCYVLIDLKIGKLTHQDIGQMQMYVNYFDRFVKTKMENPTVGIILCQKKREALVRITLPDKANIHAKEYQLYLPSKELLKQKLIDWIEEADADDQE
jgi:predicted nuclease of restriction endonuclease-like (RecB) superfamily